MNNKTQHIINTLQGIRDKMAAAAQRVYNDWVQDEDGIDDHYGGGGICDDVSEAMADTIAQNTPYDAITIHNEAFCHTACYVVDYENKILIKADISPYNYEQGTAYTWKKKDGVVFTADMVDIQDESEFYDEWFDENGEMISENYKSLNEREKFSKILYHGSPFIFKDFKNTITFFSDVPQFAIDYSDTKSFDAAMDEEPKLYTVQVETELYDPENKQDQQTLFEALPNEVEFAYNNFGFTTKQPKKKIIGWMSGNDVEEPYEPAMKAEVGDTFPDPMYERDTFTVIKRDKDYVYTFPTKRLSWIKEYMVKDLYDANFDRDLVKKWKPLQEFAKQVFKEKYPNEYFSPLALLALINSLLGHKSRYDYMNFETTPEQQKEFQNLHNQIWSDILETIASKEDNLTKWTLKPLPYKMKDTWRYFENPDVINTIISLGYGGYRALESGHNTYAIFNPKKDVKIIEYQIPVGKVFKSWNDFQSYKKYNMEFATLYKEKYDKYPWSYDIYLSWSQKKPVTQGVEDLAKEKLSENARRLRKFIRTVLIENQIQGGKADKMTPKKIADKFNLSVSKIEAQLAKGVEVELEHTNDKKLAREIALDHLTEFPDYYDRLDTMEKKAEKDWKHK